MIIQTILLDPSGAVWTDEAPNVSRLDPSGGVSGLRQSVVMADEGGLAG
jgi:hypothetical protein